MNEREFLNMIADGTVNDEIAAHAAALLEKMDAANAKRREKSAEKAAARKAEKAPLREALVACLCDEHKTASTLIAESGLEIKPQAVSSLFRDLVAAGDIEKVDVKVKGKGKQVGYKLA